MKKAELEVGYLGTLRNNLEIHVWQLHIQQPLTCALTFIPIDNFYYTNIKETNRAYFFFVKSNTFLLIGLKFSCASNVKFCKRAQSLITRYTLR